MKKSITAVLAGIIGAIAQACGYVDMPDEVSYSIAAALVIGGGWFLVKAKILSAQS